MALAEGMALAPYSVLNSGRFQTAAVFAEREKENPGRHMLPLVQHDKDVSAHLEKIVEKKGTDIFKVAVAYVMHKAPYVFPIVGGRKVGHIQGSIEALDVKLTDEDIKEIEDGYRFDHGFPHSMLSLSILNPAAAPRGAAGPQDVMLNQMGVKLDFVERPKPIA
jgi:aryl-alcohol dehydrogenase-like predicted oxidoreductase